MLRSVDVQQVLIQSNSMERVQQTQQQHPDMQQRYFSVQLSEERKLLKETVKGTEESDKSQIRKKDEEEGKQKQAKKHEERKEKGKSAQENADAEGVEQGRLVDIKV